MATPNDFAALAAAMQADLDALAGGVPVAEVELTLPSGYALTFTADGLSRVVHQGEIVALGPTKMLNGNWFYGLVPHETVWNLPVLAKSLVQVGNIIRVTHTYGGSVSAQAVYDYTVVGNDVHVTTTVTSLGVEIPVSAFHSPFVATTWDQASNTGFNLGYDQSHTRALGVPLAYPSSNIPFAASYINTTTTTGAPIRMAQWARGDLLDPSMTLKIGIYPLSGVGQGIVFLSPVSAGGSRVFKWGYRFASASDELLGGYVAHVQAQTTLQYTPTYRPYVQFAHLGIPYLRPDNPYGYLDSGSGVTRRFDKPEGVADYVTGLGPPMVEAGCAGVLMWQPQGVNPRGAMYRPDFHVWPSVVEANLPALVNGFAAQGLTVGLLARPSHTITSATWDTDWLARTGGSAGALKEVAERIQWAVDRGFQHWYLDSFIMDGEDHDILKTIRQVVGPLQQLYLEFPTVASMAYAGGYEEMWWENDTWHHSARYLALRPIFPDAPWIVKWRGSLPPGGYAAWFDYCKQERLSPLPDDWLVWGNVDNVTTLMHERWGVV